ncbi:hypothetical protein RKE29_09350 [Streptomyces sp. B1866]|uniref:hypothetical protein n=1 Tax=Streptomyces sp. B1866 TaxID=3075431 RepID=UPI00288C7F0C|nr:hypothetical protein [Streptomyces sp. B1866]MDT3396846.1 hypothetical protein [Streptomyces sp. B1866]
MTKQSKSHESDGRRADAAEAARSADEERATARPFGYPHAERHPGVRATRHISREQADADSVPGVPGGYGTTGGGQPGGSGAGIRPDREGTLDPAEYADTIGAGEPAPDKDADRDRD